MADINYDKVTVLRKGATYQVPRYGLTSDGLKEIEGAPLTIHFVKGSIEGGQYAQNGTICENLLSMIEQHLSSLNQGELSSKYTSKCIEHVRAAKQALLDRKNDRDKRGVLGTYKK